ncbi:MAG TPA: 16S rRNA (cytosine(1402)-N(4))-methyltransferase RsmH [Candidatus Nanopelagicaceae bacterium]|nr:16S rRNA (cytosine(1402)-N(4))-methyltransferase RsmH [Candidatus Nanopelagicaceae bacterium]
MRAKHEPVMLSRCLALLAPALASDDAICVDATLGLGGHSEAILRTLPKVHLIGLDRDLAAIELATQRLAEFSDRLTVAHAIYDQLPRVLKEAGISGVQGILFDLGVSSMQLDDRDRGFAYSQDAPLDMRMDNSQGISAAEVVNTYSFAELARVLWVYGEERFAKRVANAIVRERSIEPFTNTARLAEVVRSSIPAATRRVGGHPAKRSFQALRIEVNDEMDVLARAIPAALDCLAVGGRMVVLSYHSLEDRIVKREFVARSQSSSPQDLPVELPGHEPKYRQLVRGAEEPSAAEVIENPRSASAKLRAIERLAA